MTLLLISPDYASHAIPLLTIAGAWQRRGQRVVVATGPTMAPLVRAAGMEHAELIMSRGSNPGLIRNQQFADEEARSLDRFFSATRQGMIETLRYQAEARSVDLLWHPRQVAQRTMRLVDLHRPDTILVDHLAFGATIGLRAIGAPYGDIVLGHPTALPVGNEIYGVPSAWPPVLNPDLVELDSLRATARGVTEAFTSAYNDTLHSITPGQEPVADAFAAHGAIVVYNYPAELHGPIRTAQLPRHAFVGSAVRSEPTDDETSAWLAQDPDRRLVVVSLGTFLAARGDVLTRIASALRRLDVRVAIAIGPNDPASFGSVPSSWLVRPSLPQVSLLAHASLLITHAGNNSVTEALTFGVPMLAMPFSTDQFDGAASIERNLAGVALDPNTASRPLIAGSVRGLLEAPPPTPERLGKQLRRLPGSELAYAAMASAHDPSQEHEQTVAHVVPAPPSPAPS